MKHFRKYLAGLFIALLSGCVSFPKTQDQFRSSAVSAHSFSVPQSLQTAYELIAKNTIRCHSGDTSQMSMVGGSFFVFPTGSTRVEGKLEEASGQAVISVRFSNQTADGLMQVIDLKRVTETETQVLVHRLNDTKKWTSATQSVEGWFNGGTSCFDQ